MRSTRTMLATAAATAVLAIGAPAAYAAGGDWSQDDSSYSTDSSWGGSHDGPHGGMHTGGGALALRPADSGHGKDKDKDKDWGSSSSSSTGSSSASTDSGSSSGGKDSSDWSKDSGSGSGSSSWSGDHEKPHGGMHTGGGALAAAPSVTAGGLAVLALAGAGLFTVRRKKSATGVA
ncbi:hypothetical protein [Streptomyces sp. YIM S03343]